MAESGQFVSNSMFYFRTLGFAARICECLTIILTGQKLNDLIAHTRWTTHKMRSFMEVFARSRSMDPLLPETWYKITSADIFPLQVFFSRFFLSLSSELPYSC